MGQLTLSFAVDPRRPENLSLTRLTDDLLDRPDCGVPLGVLSPVLGLRGVRDVSLMRVGGPPGGVIGGVGVLGLDSISSIRSWDERWLVSSS